MDPSQSSPNPAGEQEKVSPREARARLARAGDVCGILDLITHAQPGLEDPKSLFTQLQLALDVASTGDPAGFADLVFQKMAAFSSYVLLRLQVLCLRCLDCHDGHF